MAFRQPYRSGLRELAEGLLRTAQTKKEADRLQTEMKLLQSQQQAEMIRGITGALAQGAQGFGGFLADDAARKQAEADANARDTGAAARGRAGTNADSVRNQITTLTALGGNPQEIARLQTLLTNLEGAAVAPLTSASDLYNQAMTGTYGAAPSEIRMQGAPTQSQLPPGFLPGTGWTGTQVMTEGAGAAANAQRLAAVDDRRAEALMNDIAAFNPDDPASVWRAKSAIDRASNLPAGLRAPITQDAAAIQAAFEASPEAQEMYDRANRTAEANTALAEGAVDVQDLQLQRADAELDWFQKTRAPEWARLNYQLGDANATMVVNALNTGVTTGLNERQLSEVAELAGTTVENLPEWSREKVAQTERLAELDVQRAEKTIAAMDQTFQLGEQEFTAREVQMTREDWRYAREQLLAGEDDQTRVIQGLANAVGHNDTVMLAYYMTAFDDPTNPIGIQLRTQYGDDYDMVLAGFYRDANERQALEMQAIRDDVSLREINLESAELALEQKRVLTPLETEAMRARFELDEAAAHVAFRDLEFNTSTEAIARVGELARAVPPEFWDNPPGSVVSKLEAMGLTPDYFRGISEHEEFLRGSEVRRQGWEFLSVLMENPPENEMARENMIDGIYRSVEMMGITDPVAQSAFMSSVMSAWAVDDETMRQRWAQLALQGAKGQQGGLEPVDMKRILDGWSSLATSLRQEALEVKPQAILNSGCAMPLNLGVVEGTFGLNPETWQDTPACTAMRIDYEQSLTRYANANQQQEFWAQQLGGAGGVTTPAPVSGGATPARAATPTAQADADLIGSTTVSPMHVSVFNEIANAIRSGNKEAETALMAEMGAVYGTAVAEALVRQILREPGN